jgi:hypothetical protein
LRLLACHHGDPRPYCTWMRTVGMEQVQMVLLVTCPLEDERDREIY